LPVAAWQRTSGDYFYQIFAQLHRLLHGAGQLQARVAFEECPLSSPQPDAPGCRPKSWSHSLVDMLPPPLVLRLASKSIEGYSREVGHSLGYELRWQGQGGASESPAPAAPSGRWGAVPEGLTDGRRWHLEALASTSTHSVCTLHNVDRCRCSRTAARARCCQHAVMLRVHARVPPLPPISSDLRGSGRPD